MFFFVFARIAWFAEKVRVTNTHLGFFHAAILFSLDVSLEKKQ